MGVYIVNIYGHGVARLSTKEQYEEPSKHIVSIGNHEKGMVDNEVADAVDNEVADEVAE